MKLLLTLFLLLTAFISQSQEVEATIQTTGLLGSSSGNLPFWMTHNELGRYAITGNAQSLTEAMVSGKVGKPGRLTFSYGSDLAILVSEKGADPKVIEAWMGLSGKTIRLQAGAFAEPEVMEGLSSSNGDLLRSRNARPYPKVQLSTPGFIPFLVAKKWLRIKAEYDEGILYGQRVVAHPHLHHKSMMFRVLPSPTLRFTMGLNHYVFWGGTSETYGPLPDGLDNYIRYVTGAAGNNSFQVTEQQNVAGNQLGDYLFSMEKDFTRYRLQLQLSHPFEDGSGMGFENLKDNLYTLYLAKKQQGSLLDAIVVEYLFSKHQGGSKALDTNTPDEHKRGSDDYFNHSIYRTGFTYLEQSMGTPLFEPLQYAASGKVGGVSNNRVSAFHLGAKGCLTHSLSWKALVTCSRNFGTYRHPFPSPRPQLYSLARLEWKLPKSPLALGVMVGVDHGELITKQIGVGLQASWYL